MSSAQYIRAYPRTARESCRTLQDRTVVGTVQGGFHKDLCINFFAHPRLRYDRILIPLTTYDQGDWELRVAVYDPKDRSRVHYEALTWSGGTPAGPKYWMQETLLGAVVERDPGWLVFACKWSSDDDVNHTMGLWRPNTLNEPVDVLRDTFVDVDWSETSLKLIVEASGYEAVDSFLGFRDDGDLVMPSTLPAWAQFTGSSARGYLALFIDGQGWEGDVDGVS